MARRASHFEPQGRNSLSHKQQLAMVAAGGVKGAAAGSARESIYAHGGISGDDARKLVGKGWFFADKQMLSAVDSGLDSRLSSSEARRQLDAIYGSTQPVE